MQETDRSAPIAMEIERLGEYAGSYIVPGFGRIEVSLEEDALVAQSRIGNFGLLPQSPDIFRVEDIGDSLAFRRENGELLSEVMLEGAMIGAGYGQLSRGNTEQAIAIFRRCAGFFPDSWNAHDSLGEAYERNGDRDLAVESYRRSLELNPGNGNAREKLEQLRDSME
jgi:tetratricopeptide (TPR) repeat protein